MATIEQLYEGIRRAGAANDADAVRALGAELSRMQSQQAQPAAAESPVERPDLLVTPIEYQGRPPEQVGATLNDLVPPPELAADLLKVKSPQGGAPTESNVEAIYGQIERTGSIRDVLNKEVASGGLNPTATLDPQKYPVLAPIWEQYKKEMEPSMIGAATRGAISQAGPTVGGLAGGAAGSLMGGMALPGSIGGSVLGGMAQQEIVSEFQTPQEQQAAQSQAAFDRAKAQWSRAAGEVAPQLLSQKAAFNTIGRALAGETKAIADVALGSIIGGGLAKLSGGTTADVTLGAIAGGALQPRQFIPGTKIPIASALQRDIRTEQAAQQGARRIVQEFATEAGGVPEQLATRIEQQAPVLMSGGVTPLTTEISGNEGLISLGNALANINKSLLSVRQKSREAVSRNFGQAMQESGATFQEAKAFFQQQTQKLQDDAIAARDAFIRSGDRQAASLIESALGAEREAFQRASQNLATAEDVLDTMKQALETARIKIASRTGVRDSASSLAKEVWERERINEKKLVDAAYKPQNVSTLRSDAKNTLEAAREAAGPQGAGLFGDLPEKIKEILVKLEPKKDVPTSVSVQDLRSGIAAINGKIGASTDANEIRLLKIAKEGFEKDIEALGDISSEIAAANQKYRAYKEKYGGKTGDAVQFGKVEDSRTIDAYLSKPLETQYQFRAALKDDPEALQAVQDWIINDLATSVGEKPTPARFNKWLKDRNVEGWLKVFPEVRASVDAFAKDVTQATEAVTAAEGVRRTFTQQLRELSKDASQLAKDEAKDIKKAAAFQAKERFNKQQKEIADSAAFKVLKKSPVKAIRQMMDSGDPEEFAKELMQSAAKDPSGKATEGVKNAMYQYLSEETALFGKVASTAENPTATISKEDFERSFKLLNEMLVQGKDARKAITAIFGKGSKELGMLDLYRGQLDVMERFRRAAAGQSVTSLNTELAKRLAESEAKNMLGLFARVAYGITPPGLKQSGTGSAVRAAGALLDKFVSVSGDPSGRARAIMVEAMTDPELMAKLLRPLNKDTLPEAKTLIKLYLVPQGAETKQESQ
jgi:hypothetical protein